ncbi:MAG: DNA/RNA helicase domain-containing protein [Verrucomicrobiota bacterium]
MIVYLETKRGFREDVLSNRIDEKILEVFRQKLGKRVGESEMASWKNSLPFMSLLLEDPGIPADTGVAIEFNIPNTAKRIDFILTGKRTDGHSVAVIIELKQWKDVQQCAMDAIVQTFLGGTQRETNHPSYQAWSYAMLIEDYNESVQLDPIHLRPCAYLHNCESDAVINHKHYAEHTRRAPAFLKDDAHKLREFIKSHVKFGDSGKTMYRIRDGKIRPSKNLADHLASLLQGNREFYMLDDQKVVYEKALHLAGSSSPKNKNVLIVNGGPGTGKSVVAINLLVELTQRDQVVQYVTKNAAPREVFQSKLANSMKKTRISNMFVGSGTFTVTEPNAFHTLIVDEAHRLNEKSGMMSNQGENQIKEIISSAAFSVFFLDEDQRIHWKDIGEIAAIKEWASACGAKVTELSLESQFRCNGSDGYLAWIDNSLQIRSTANPTLEGIDYDFKVCDSASELRDLIYRRNQHNNKSRMVAGYCWDWKSKSDPKAMDIEFPDQGFAAQWNLSDDGSLWIIKPESVKQIGCIHTCQGLELDYVGVIIGEDFLVRDGVVVADGKSRSTQDRSMHGYKKLFRTDPEDARKKAAQIIKNTYRTLMTRGQKGCYVYSVDPETNRYLKECARGIIETSQQPVVEESKETLPFRILDINEVVPYVNAVPKFDFKIAAGAFSAEQWVDECEWVELPEHLQAREGYFVAQVIGESMNRKIPNGSWCLFRANPVGSRQGKIVLVQLRSIQDPDYSASFTIKSYHSEKERTEDGWQHSRIVLKPMSNDPHYLDINLEKDEVQEMRVLGEYVAII